MIIARTAALLAGPVLAVRAILLLIGRSRGQP